MSAPITLAEILSGKRYANLTHPCGLCGEPVFLMKNTPRDENGRALHESCRRRKELQTAA